MVYTVCMCILWWVGPQNTKYEKREHDTSSLVIGFIFPFLGFLSLKRNKSATQKANNNFPEFWRKCCQKSWRNHPLPGCTGTYIVTVWWQLFKKTISPLFLHLHLVFYGLLSLVLEDPKQVVIFYVRFPLNPPKWQL